MEVLPSPNGNGSNTTGNTVSGGTDNSNLLYVDHGMPIEHRFLVKTFDRTGRGPWITDILFPQILSGITDLYAIDEATASMLFGIVQAIRPKVLFETGTHRGRSTRAIVESLFVNQQGHLWTVDMDDYGLMVSGAIREHEKPFVTQVVGRTPEVFAEEPLQSLMGIDFAFIDGDHTKEGLIADLEYVDAHRAEHCVILVDNANDDGWPQVREYFKTYRKYPNFLLPTMTGIQMIWMGGYDSKNR